MARLNYGRRLLILDSGDVMDFIQDLDGFRLLYPLQETDGAVAVATNPEIGAVAASTSYPGPELLVDGDMEAVDTSAYYALQCMLSKEMVIVQDGSRSLEMIATDITARTYVQLSGVAGKRLNIAGWVYVPNGNSLTPQLRLGTSNSGNDIGSIIFTSIKGIWIYTTGQIVCSVDNPYFNMSGAANTETIYIDNLTIREANLLNGDIVGATIDQAVPYPLLYMVSLDGINDYISIGSTALDVIWDGDLFTISGFIIANTGMFTDTVQRAFINIGADANNYVQVGSDGAGNLQALVKSGGTLKTLTYASPSEDVLLHWAVKRNGANCELVVNGISRDTDTGLPAWSGSLDTTLCVIGAGSTVPVNCYVGKIGAVAYHHAEVDNGTLMKLAHMAGAG